VEDFGSIDEAPDDFCRRKVDECDLFVCIAGPLYGFRSPAGASFTEREFDAAILSKKPCLVIMTAEDYPLAANPIEADKDRECQHKFRKKISKDRIIDRFSTADEVSVKVVQAIGNWERRRGPTREVLQKTRVRSVSYRVAVMNKSTMVCHDEVTAAMAALQTQVRRDYAPVWGVGAELPLIGEHTEAPPGSWGW